MTTERFDIDILAEIKKEFSDRNGFDMMKIDTAIVNAYHKGKKDKSNELKTQVLDKIKNLNKANISLDNFFVKIPLGNWILFNEEIKEIFENGN